jgi:hypothetical protein
VANDVAAYFQTGIQNVGIAEEIKELLADLAVELRNG